MKYIIRRMWTYDVYAFYCAQEMERLGIQVISILAYPKTLYPKPGDTVYLDKDFFWDVWGRAEAANDQEFSELCTHLDNNTDAEIEKASQKGRD